MTSALASHLWQSTWFALAAAVLALALRRNRAQIRYALWLCASFKFLVPFGLLVDLGRSLSSASATPFSALPPVPAAVARISQQWVSPTAWTQAAPLQPVPASHALLIAMFTIWAAGVAAIATWRLRAWRRLRALVCASQPLALVGLTLPRGVETRSVAGVLEPGVVGWLRPKLLLPAGIATHLEPDQLRAVLAHELCHIRRRDNLASALHMLVEALFWFHPLVWWVGARLVAERERACDEEVLRRGSEPREYAHGILNVCRWFVESPAPWGAGVSGADLKLRIEAILSGRFAARLSPIKKAALAAAGLAALAAPIAAGMLPQAATPPKLHFDVVSIKAWGPNEHLPSGFVAGTQVLPGRVLGQCEGLSSLVYFAYKLTGVEPVEGMPKWAHASCSMEGATNAYMVQATMPASATRDEARRMMQSLLAERFQFAAHWTTRQMPVLNLVVAKGGLKIKPFDPAGDQRRSPIPRCPSDSPGCQTFCCGPYSITNLAGMLSREMGRPVIDRTKLPSDAQFGTKGMFIRWRGNTDTESSLPSLPTLFHEQFGLDLKPARGPVQVLVIDHVEKPSSN